VASKVSPLFRAGLLVCMGLLIGLFDSPSFAQAPDRAQRAEGQASVTEGGDAMNTYIIIFGFTSERIANIKDSPHRVQAAQKVVESLGGKMKSFYAISAVSSTQSS
jgi:hypothetical protein